MEDLFNPGTCQWVRTCLTEAFHPSAVSGGFRSNAVKTMERSAATETRGISILRHVPRHHSPVLLSSPPKINITINWRISFPTHDQMISMKERTNWTRNGNIPHLSHAPPTSSDLINDDKGLLCV